MSNYRHTQIGHAIIYPLVSIAGICLAFAAFSPTLHIALALLLIAGLFSKMTIRIDGPLLRASFGPGLIRKNVPLDQIASCKAFRIRWWEGWGIHLSRHGWLYNVSGWDAVAIRLRDGREVALGTDDPEGLMRALNERAPRL